MSRAFGLMILISLLLSCGNSNNLKREPLELQKMFCVSDIPGLDSGTLTLNTHTVEIDAKENVYFAVTRTHHILKCDHAGQPIEHIGSIGQDDGLFYPTNIYLDVDRFWVVDNQMKSIKELSLDGVLSNIPLEGIDLFSEIGLDTGLFYTNARFNKNNGYENKPLFTVFSREGKPLRGFGEAINSNRFIGYTVFNDTMFEPYKDRIYGCFRFLPVIFCFEKSGKEVFRREMKGDRFPEIADLDHEAQVKGNDRPFTVKEEHRCAGRVYFQAFTLDGDGDFLLVQNVPTKGRCLIYRFDENGNFRGWFIPICEGLPLRTAIQIRYRNRHLYILGRCRQNDKLFLMKSKLEF